MQTSHQHTLLLCCTISLLLTACAGSDSSSGQPAESDVGKTQAETADSVFADVQAPFDAAGMHFSAGSGFYDSAFCLTVSADSGSTVYYTLDGSMPDADSLQYTAPICIQDRSQDENKLSMHTDIAQPAAYAEYFLPAGKTDKATVLRAVAIDSSGRQSDTVTLTYFIGYDQKAAYYQDTAVISLITDEKNLFDFDTGIYTLGKTYDDWKNGPDYDAETPDYFMPANYTQKGKAWERQATLQFFADGQLAASQDFGIRIHGGATRSYPQKSLKVYARKEYGAGKLEYDLFSGTVRQQNGSAPITEFDSFVLRNGGNDAQYTRFSDKLVQSLTADRAFLTQGMTPCILFINGEFWGQYELTEKVDADTIHSHYGVPANDVCLIKKEALESGTEAGFQEWKQLWNWIRNTDFSQQDTYGQLCSAVDMQSFMDYVSTEIYINNADWGKPNSAMWKAQTVDGSNPCADGKWRFILFDTEFSSGLYGKAQPDENSFETLLEKDCFLADLFRAALANDSFRSEFADTFLEIAAQNFGKARVSSEIDRLSAARHDMAIDTYNRFWSKIVGGAEAERNYQDAVDSLRQFYDQRYEFITECLEETIGKP